MPEVDGGCLSQSCQWLSPVMQTKLTKVHFETRELVLPFVVGFASIAPKPDNPVN